MTNVEKNSSKDLKTIKETSPKEKVEIKAEEKKGSKKVKKVEKKIKTINYDYFVDEERSYEIMLIIDPDITEDKIKKAKANLKKLIEAEGGKITFEDDTWGLREFCYKIQHKTHGIYYLLNFVVKGTKIVELDKQLQIDREILRHLIIKLPEDFKPEKYDDLKEKFEIKIDVKPERKKSAPKFIAKKEIISKPKEEVVTEKVAVVVEKKELKIETDRNITAEIKEEEKKEIEIKVPKVNTKKIEEIKEKNTKEKKDTEDHLDELNEKLDKLLLSDDLDNL